LIVSVANLKVNGSFSSTAPHIFSFLSPVSSSFGACTGSSTLISSGIFGAFSASPSISLARTPCVQSSWTSDSSLSCKSAWGLGAQLTLTISIAATTSQATAFRASFDEPKVLRKFSFVNSSLLNASSCMFADSSLCSNSQIVAFVSNASGFGSFLSLINVTLEGHNCNHVTWMSDSSLYCAYPHAVSKALFTLKFALHLIVNSSIYRTSYLPVDNPFFVAKSPQVNNSLHSVFYWPNDPVPVDEAIGEYMRFGHNSQVDLRPNKTSAALVQFFESVTVKLVAYIRDFHDADTQVFTDLNSVPIAKTIRCIFSLSNAESRSDASTLFCRVPDAINITILPEFYAAVLPVELSFCAIEESNVILVLNSTTEDELGKVVSLPSYQFALTLRPLGNAIINASVLQSSQIQVGKEAALSLQVMYHSGSLLPCSSMRFEFSVALQCAFQTHSSAVVPRDVRSRQCSL